MTEPRVVQRFTCAQCGRVQLLTDQQPYAYICTCFSEVGIFETWWDDLTTRREEASM